MYRGMLASFLTIACVLAAPKLSRAQPGQVFDGMDEVAEEGTIARGPDGRQWLFLPESMGGSMLLPLPEGVEDVCASDLSWSDFVWGFEGSPTQAYLAFGFDEIRAFVWSPPAECFAEVEYPGSPSSITFEGSTEVASLEVSIVFEYEGQHVYEPPDLLQEETIELSDHWEGPETVRLGDAGWQLLHDGEVVFSPTGSDPIGQGPDQYHYRTGVEGVLSHSLHIARDELGNVWFSEESSDHFELEFGSEYRDADTLWVLPTGSTEIIPVSKEASASSSSSDELGSSNTNSDEAEILFYVSDVMLVHRSVEESEDAEDQCDSRMAGRCCQTFGASSREHDVWEVHDGGDSSILYLYDHADREETETNCLSDEH